MMQTELTFARNSDVQTSHDAATLARAFVASHRAKIFAALERYDRTAKEIALATGLSDVQVARRLKSMLELGLIERTGETRKGCCVWRRV